MSRSEKGILLLVIVLAAMLIGYLGLNRSFYTYATETDYLGGFRPEAERLLEGKPLLLSFHPPFYSIVLAGMQTLIDNWFKTGIIVSFVSCLVVLVSNFYLLEKSCGRFAGWATLAGLTISSPFLAFSCFATSDIFFLALYSISLLAAFVAYEKNSKITWALCGFVCGLTLLTRSNSITLFALLIVPWLSNIPVKQRSKNFLSMLFGLCLPLVIWISYAKATGSSLAPAGNHVNLALTYFSHGTDRISGDARAPLEKEFTSLWQVLSHDPLHIAKTYVKDLLRNKAFHPNELFPFPFNYLVILSLVAIFFRKPKTVFWYYLVILTILQGLLVNFKAYETRYYIFLVPIIASFVGLFLESISNLLPHKIWRNIGIPLLVIGIVLSGSRSVKNAFSDLHRDDEEIGEAIAKIEKIVENNQDTTIVARKPHIPYYLGLEYKFVPRVKTIQELGEYFEKNKTTQHMYLYYGAKEKHSRPQFKNLKDENSHVFKVVTQSDKEDLWTLYEYTGLSAEN